MDAMKINADFNLKVVIKPEEMTWNPSPVPGINRAYLDRVGGEVAKASSIVKYKPNSTFTQHEHGEGEEILVLDGTFSDENGNYSAGTYLRNPPSITKTSQPHTQISPMGVSLKSIALL